MADRIVAPPALVKCPVCDATEHRPVYDQHGYTIVECISCAHGFVERMPTDAELDALYTESAESFLGSGAARAMAAYLGDRDDRFFAFYADRLRAIARTGAAQDSRILDFGCSQGAFVATLEKKGFRNVCGFDLSATSVAEGRDRWGLDLRTGDFEDFVTENAERFDVVHAGNVLEHVRDPLSIVKSFRRLLASGGHLVTSVPNSRSLQVRLAGTRSPVIDPPHHLQYFGPSSLSTLISRGDFEVTRVETEFWQPASDLYLNMKGIPLWAARVVRHAMGVPGVGINALRLGGVVVLWAR
jgi:SAM-dependent methyltransferase